ncbi:MAG: hypothetical protein ACLRWP_06530 [Bilophila wadsworthia]
MSVSGMPERLRVRVRRLAAHRFESAVLLICRKRLRWRTWLRACILSGCRALRIWCWMPPRIRSRRQGSGHRRAVCPFRAVG